MPQQDAFSLLFKHDFGGRTLFKNQVDFVTELITHPASDFYFDPNNKDGYQKAFSRTKAFVSQLFSTHSVRCVSPEFSRSLEILLEEKSRALHFDVLPLLDQIVDDLKERNMLQRSRSGVAKKEGDRLAELSGKIMEADVITVFTAREVCIQLKVGDKKFTIKDFLIYTLFFSLQKGTGVKSFRFNFPLEQTCILFWKGLRQELTDYLLSNSNSWSYLLSLLNETVEQEDSSAMASSLLQYLSKKNIISVYCLKAPVYLTSVLLLQSRQHNNGSIYLFLKTVGDYEQVYRMSDQEMLLSKLFVWDCLKVSGSGNLVDYSHAL